MKISSLMNNEYKEYAISTVTDRAIPSLIDGLKPVQRFLLYQGFNTEAKSKFIKVAAIGGSVSNIGYEHGEASAQGALVSMATDFNNNIPLFLGDGSFGNKLDHTAASPRYIFAKLAPICSYLFKDNDICPKHFDPEHIPPKFYLPLIPLCIINGISGIATGFSCNIPPFDYNDIIDALISICDTGEFSNEIHVKYPMFTGTSYIEKNTGYIYRYGHFEREGTTKIIITELVPGMEVDVYKLILNKLQASDFIINYDDESTENDFRFVIKLHNGTNLTDEEIFSKFKLSDRVIPNFTVIDENNNLREYDKRTGPSDIIRDFYGYRIIKVKEGMENTLSKLKFNLDYQNSFLKFCTDVVEKKFDFQKQLNDDSLRINLITNYGFTKETISRVLSISVTSFTQKSIESTKEKIKTLEKEIQVLENTTPEMYYKQLLVALRKQLNELPDC